MSLSHPHPGRLLHFGMRCLLCLVSGWLFGLYLIPTPVQAQASWLQSKAHGEIAYFLFASPARIERYNLATASWLTALPLTATPTAFAVDADGLYVAFDRTVSRFPLDGGTATHLKNTATTVIDLFTINEFLYLNHSAYPYGRITSLNKATGVTIDSEEYIYKLMNGLSVGRTIGKLFARDSGMSPADIFQLTLNSDGTLGTAKDSPYHGAYPSATKTFLFPNESRVVDSAGIVYNTSDLTYSNSLAGAVDDLAFYGDLPIVLRSGKLVAFNNALLETGSYTPAMPPQKIYLATDKLIAFAPGSTRGVQAAAIDLSLLNPAPPATAVNPVGLNYVPDALLLGNDEILYLFSKTQLSIFRWSVAARAYLPTLALTQAPSHVAYSPVTNRLYLAYASGKLTQIRLDDGNAETPFANSPQTPCGLATAGEYIFVCDPSGAWESHFTYHPDGTLISQVEWNYFSKAYIWSAANRKLYFFRDDTSPNDLLWEAIDHDGKLGTKQDSPYHSSEGMLHPIRVAPDGSVVLLGSGRLYDPNSLAQVDSLSNNITDAAWRNGRLYTTRQLTDQTQIQQWGTTYGLEKGVNLTSAGTTLFAVNDGLLAVTNYLGLPRFVLLDDELNVRYQSPTLFGLTATNNSPAASGQTVLFQSALQAGAGTVTYHWDFGDGAQSTGKLVSHHYASVGVYTATVSAKNAVETITATTTVTITGMSSDEPITGLTIVATSPTTLGGTTHLTATVQSGTNVSYQWALGDGSTANSAQIAHTYGAEGYYTVTVTATNNVGRVTATAIVRVVDYVMACVPLTAVTIEPATTTGAYVGNVQDFSAVVEPTRAANTMSYQFLVNDDLIRPLFSPYASFASYTFAEPGSYTVSVIATNGCSEMRGSIDVTIHPRPTVQPDLSLSTKSVTAANVDVGDILTYTIHLRNQQPLAAQIKLTDTLSAYTTYLPARTQASSGELTFSDYTLFWAGEVVSGTPVVLTYAVQVNEVPGHWEYGDQMITSSGRAIDQFGNVFSLDATSTHNPGYQLFINGGARYTNQAQVTLSYTWNAADDIQFIKFSNHSGFDPEAGTTDWLPVNAQNTLYANWQLTPWRNSGALPTVYALFRDDAGNQVGPFQDDIILDTLPPQLLQVTWLTALVRNDQAAAGARIRVTASDNNSGMTLVEFSTQPTFANVTTYPMSGRTLDVELTPSPVGPLYVRARDRAGNHSAAQTLTAGGTLQIFLPVVNR